METITLDRMKSSLKFAPMCAIKVKTIRAEYWAEIEKTLQLSMDYIQSNIDDYVRGRTEGTCTVKDRILLDGMRFDLERVRKSLLQVLDDKEIYG